MKKTTLKRRNWMMGGSALFLLYTTLHSGGILYRLVLLVAATGCFALWSRSKEQLDALALEVQVAPPPLKVEAAVRDVQVSRETLPYFAKMPVRYPRPVYIHKRFELQRH